MKYNKFIFFIILSLSSCNKEYNSIGVNLINNNSLNSGLEEVPVFVKMKKIPPYVVNNIESYQLGVYDDNIFGKSEATYLAQLTLETVEPVFGIFNQSQEISGDENNIAVIDEEETLKRILT